jgi:hypothetical protein
MREDGRTILFVTHDMSAVNRFCHRALLLERGRMVSMGIPHEVSGEYLAVNFRHERKVDATEATDPLRDRAAFIAEAWFEDERGERVEFLTQGQSCVCRVRVEINWELHDPTFVLAIESEGGARVFATSSAWLGQETGSFSAGEQVVFSVAFDNPLAPGRYYISPQVTLLTGPQAGVVDRRDRAAATVVTGTDDDGGLVSIPHDFTLERISARELSA